MTDARMGVPATVRRDGPLSFLRETAASLRNRRIVGPTLVLTILLTASNIIILLNRPVEGEPPIVFAIAAFVRVAGLWFLAVAILRLLNDSARRPYRPDAGFWLYGLTFLFGIAASIGLTVLGGDKDDPVAAALQALGLLVVGAPPAAWFTAIAVERPLAANPRPWLRGFRRWLLPLILWSVLILLPLGQLHRAIDLFLLEGAGDNFWPLTLFDGPLSAVMAVFGLALASTAYRRVARG